MEPTPTTLDISGQSIQQTQPNPSYLVSGNYRALVFYLTVLNTSIIIFLEDIFKAYIMAILELMGMYIGLITTQEIGSQTTAKSGTISSG